MSENLDELHSRLRELNRRYRELDEELDQLATRLAPLKDRCLDLAVQLDEERPRTPVEMVERELDALKEPFWQKRDAIVQLATDTYNRAIEEAEAAYNLLVDPAEEECELHLAQLDEQFAARFEEFGDEDWEIPEVTSEELDALKEAIATIQIDFNKVWSERLATRHELNAARRLKDELRSQLRAEPNTYPD